MIRLLVLVAVLQAAGVSPVWASGPEPPRPQAAVTAAGDDADQTAGALDAGDDADQPVPAPFDQPSFGPMYRLQEIVVRGNRKTETALILGEMGIHPGETLTPSDGRVEAARIHLLALGFFLDVRLALEKGRGRGDVVLIVDVEERGTVILNALYLGSSAATSFWGGLEVAENNLLGRGISLGTGFVASTRPDVGEAARNFGARVRTLVPPLGNTGLMLSGTGILVSGSEFIRARGSDTDASPGTFEALRYKRVGGVIGVGRALTRSARLFLDFREEGTSSDFPSLRTRTSPAGAEVPLDFGIAEGFSRVGSLTATLDFDTRSDPLVPRAGSHVSLSIEGATANLLSSYEFVKLVLQGSFYRPTRHGHIVGVHLFGGALFGSAPFFDRFFVGDMNLFLPPRALGLNFSTQPSRDLLGTAIAGHRYDDFAARVLTEYAVPLWRRHRLIYSGDAFVAFGAFAMGSRGAFRDGGRSGLAAWPIDLTGDLGIRLDTAVGVFTLSFANALGRVPF